MAKPTRKPPLHLFDQSGIVVEALQMESDRGAALVCAAYLDDALAALLRAALADDPAKVDSLLEQDGTFSARIKLAYCMGLITAAEARNLDIIRGIRNKPFAHQFDTGGFGDPTVKDRCGNLTFPTLALPPSGHLTARRRFESVAILTANRLVQRGMMTRHASPARDLDEPLGFWGPRPEPPAGL